MHTEDAESGLAILLGALVLTIIGLAVVVMQCGGDKPAYAESSQELAGGSSDGGNPHWGSEEMADIQRLKELCAANWDTCRELPGSETYRKLSIRVQSWLEVYVRSLCLARIADSMENQGLAETACGEMFVTSGSMACFSDALQFLLMNFNDPRPVLGKPDPARKLE